MDSYDVEMQLLQEQNSEDYAQLLHLLRKRHYATFKSLVLRALSKDPPRVDLNHKIGHPVNMTFLEAAARDDLGSFVEFLLEAGAEPNRVNADQKRAALHFAAERGSEEALAVLLRCPSINPNLEVAGLTALHLAVKAGHKECARLLLEAGASPNVPNSQGLTALHFAAEKGTRDMVELILEHSEFLILDVFKDRKKETARSVIAKKYPDLALPEASAAPSAGSLLRYYLTANDEANFAESLGRVEELDELGNKAELLRLAVEKDLRQATAKLLERGALEQENLLELARIAVRRGCPETLLVLVKRNARLADKLLLPVCQELGVSTGPGPRAMQKRLECFKIVVGQESVNVRQEDDKGNSPLHYAARAECQEAVELLLRRGSYIGHVNNYGVPPLAHLPAASLENRLNECVSCSDDRSEEYEISLDYGNLVPHGISLPGEEVECTKRPARPCNETDPLLYIAEHRHLRHLLKHPLLSSFLYLKFLRIRHLLYANFLLYAAFYVVLNTYIWVLSNDAPELEESNDTSAKPDSQNLADASNIEELENWKKHPLLSCLVLAGLVYLLTRESLQAISSPFYYFLSPVNWLEVCLIGLAAGLLCNAGPEIGALAVLLSTWELVILLSQHPRMSTDIEMFKTVTINFTKFLFLYVFLILAFALSFFVLFRGHENFPNPMGSLFKTIVMLSGEFDSGEIPFAGYPVLSRLIFVGFIFLVVIILLNLLNGLAVNDTAEILAEAELVGLVARAQLLAYIERVAVGSSSLKLGCLDLGRLPLEGLRQAPLSFVARRLLMFPRFLPQTRLSVKPLKNFEMTLHGRPEIGKRSSKLYMDKLVARRAKEIVEARGKESGLEKALAQLRSRFDGLEAMLREIRSAVGGNNDAFEGFDRQIEDVE